MCSIDRARFSGSSEYHQSEPNRTREGREILLETHSHIAALYGGGTARATPSPYQKSAILHFLRWKFSPFSDDPQDGGYDGGSGRARPIATIPVFGKNGSFLSRWPRAEVTKIKNAGVVFSQGIRPSFPLSATPTQVPGRRRHRRSAQSGVSLVSMITRFLFRVDARARRTDLCDRPTWTRSSLGSTTSSRWTPNSTSRTPRRPTYSPPSRACSRRTPPTTSCRPRPIRRPSTSSDSPSPKAPNASTARAHPPPPPPPRGVLGSPLGPRKPPASSNQLCVYTC